MASLVPFPLGPLTGSFRKLYLLGSANPPWIHKRTPARCPLPGEEVIGDLGAAVSHRQLVLGVS